MTKQAISITLDAANITWLKGRVGATGVRSLSELLNRLVTMARTGSGVGPVRSVMGTMTINDEDPNLEEADATVRSLFERSLDRSSLIVRDTAPPYGRATRRAPKGARRRG